MNDFRSCIAVLIATLMLEAPSAIAQTRTEESLRAVLIQQATQARSRRQWERVIQLLRQVVDIRPTASVYLGLAGAHAELGEHQEASTQASLCVQMAPIDRDAREDQRTLLLNTCSQMLRESVTHLAMVTLEGIPDIQGASLEVDGVPIVGYRHGHPFHLTPGRRNIRLMAAGSERAGAIETLRAGDFHTVSMRLTSDNQPIAATTVPTSSSVHGSIAPSSRSAAPWAVGGLGLSGAVISISFFLHSQSIISRVNSNCPNRDPVDGMYLCITGSHQSAVRSQQDALTYERASLGLAVGSGIALITSAIWLIARGSRTTHNRAWHWSPTSDGLMVRF